MKNIFCIKKDPMLPTNSNNWITMNQQEYSAFLQTDEGRMRSSRVVRVGPCEAKDVTYYIECDDEQERKKCKYEDNRATYVEKRRKESGIEIVSYHEFKLEDRDISGEDQLEDTRCNVEESAIDRVMLCSVLDAMHRLSPFQSEIIGDFFYSENPVTVRAWAKSHNVAKSTANDMKESSVNALKKLANACE